MYLIDTNVMLAASACIELSALADRAEPREIELREIMYRWLADFDQGEAPMVMDEEGLIRDEYERNMKFNPATYEQEYGMRVLQNKLDFNLVEYVTIDVQEGNGERIAVLSEELCGIVTDREDRKWVAASLATVILHEYTPEIVYGAESDWYMIEVSLQPHGIRFRRLLPDNWYETKVKAS